MSTAQSLILSVQGEPAGRFSGNREQVFDCRDGSIGRSGECDWVLGADGVSRMHAFVRYLNGLYFIEDRSTNGMLLNGTSLRRGEPAALKHGDRLQIDTFEIAVRLSGETATQWNAAPDRGRAMPVSPMPMPVRTPVSAPVPTPASTPAPAQNIDPLDLSLLLSPHRGVAPNDPGQIGPGNGLIPGAADAAVPGASLDPLALFDTPSSYFDEPASATPPEQDWNHTPAVSDRFRPPQVEAVRASSPVLPDDWDATGSRVEVRKEPRWDDSLLAPILAPGPGLEASRGPVSLSASGAASVSVSGAASTPSLVVPSSIAQSSGAAFEASPQAHALPAMAEAPANPLAPISDLQPLQPSQPLQPTQPTQPPKSEATPAPAATPTPTSAHALEPSSVVPAVTFEPAAAAAQLVQPAQPVQLTQPVQPVQPTQPVQHAQPATAPPELDAMFHIAVDVMMDVLRARAELKNSFRLPATLIQRSENNPLKFAPTAQEAVRKLFEPSGNGFLSGSAALNDAAADIRNHQMAMLAGVRSAFQSMLAHFDPAGIEESEGSVRRLSLGGRSRHWDRYKEQFDALTRNPDDCFRRLFGDEFARAYEEQLARLKNRRHE